MVLVQGNFRCAPTEPGDAFNAGYFDADAAIRQGEPELGMIASVNQGNTAALYIDCYVDTGKDYMATGIGVQADSGIGMKVETSDSGRKVPANHIGDCQALRV